MKRISLLIGTFVSVKKATLCFAEAALEERVKQLERWKERKALQKEKEKREKEHKGVFKTGLYHPKDRLVVLSLPQAPAASTRRKDVRGTDTMSSFSKRTAGHC